MYSKLQSFFHKIENSEIIKELDITEEKREGKSEKEIGNIIIINLVKKPEILNVNQADSLLDCFVGGKNFIDKNLVSELNKIVNETDYKKRFILKREDIYIKKNLDKKINLLYFLVTFILIESSYVSYFFPFLSGTIKYLYKKDEKKFILKELENDSKIKEKFIKVLTKLTYYRNEFGELKETTPDSTDSIFIRLADKIFNLIKIKIEIEGDFRGDDFEEEKLFDKLFSILNENSDYYENNKNLRYCEIKCINREEKNNKIYYLEKIITDYDKEIKEPHDIRILIIGENEDITNALFKINKKVFVCRFEI